MGKVRRLPASALENPFEYHARWTWKSKIEIVLGAIFLFPIRLVLLVTSIFLLWVGALVATWDVRPRGSRPMLPFQQNLVHYVLYYVARLVMFSMGYNWISVRGRRAPPEEAPIAVVAPHTSFSDSILVGTKVYCSSVAKYGVVNVPIFGTLLQLTEPILVNRADKASGHSVKDEIRKRLAEPTAWTQLLFFPEATCTNGQALICFKAGPFYPGVPVQPVVFRYGNTRQTWTWISTPSGYVVFFLLLCSFHNSCTVDFLPVYHPSEEEKKNPFLYAANVRAEMAKFLEVPCTEHTYEDGLLMERAASLGLPPVSGLVEYNTIHQVTNLSLDVLQEQLVRFGDADQNKDGCLSRSEFSHFLSWPVERDVMEMFAEYDTSGASVISFREFVLGYSDLALPAVSSKTAAEAFVLLSHSGACITAHTVELAFSERGVDLNSNADISFYHHLSPDSQEMDEVCFSDFLSANPEYYVLFAWFLNGRE